MIIYRAEHSGISRYIQARQLLKYAGMGYVIYKSEDGEESLVTDARTEAENAAPQEQTFRPGVKYEA